MSRSFLQNPSRKQSSGWTSVEVLQRRCSENLYIVSRQMRSSVGHQIELIRNSLTTAFNGSLTLFDLKLPSKETVAEDFAG